MNKTYSDYDMTLDDLDTVDGFRVIFTVRGKHVGGPRQFTIHMNKDGVAVHVPLGETAIFTIDGNGLRTDYP
jgi:hypothetical protein